MIRSANDGAKGARKQKRKQGSAAVPGARYGRWTVLGDAPRVDHHATWLVRCDCGAEHSRQADTVMRGKSTQCLACGTKRASSANRVHGRSRSPEHVVWAGMHARAGSQRWYHHVTIAPEWCGPDGFLRFVEHIGPRPSRFHQVDRIDPLGGYVPGNVRWVTPTEQARNRRNNRIVTVGGRSQCVAAWAEETGVRSATIIRLLNDGVPPHLAVRGMRTEAA